MQFLYSHWLRLSMHTRTSIANQFGIQKKGSISVFNNEVIADGYAIKDIEQLLNIDTLQKYLDSTETDMMVLWEDMIAKVEGRYIPKEIALVGEKMIVDEVVVEQKKRGRTSKSK